MRLLYFIPLLSTKGGQERTLTDKANYLVREGHAVLFVTYEHEGPLSYPLDPRVRHTDLYCHYFKLYRYPLWRRFIKAMQLKRRFRSSMQVVLDAFRPDVIVTVIPNTENFLPDLVSIAGQTPVVIESHLAYGRQVIRRGLTERLLYCLFPPQRAIRRAQLVIALTQGDAANLRTVNSNVRVIPNPLSFFPSQPHTPQKGRIICVGRLTPQKRFDRLIAAFASLANRYPDWHVDLFGEGELHRELQQQIDDCGMTGRIRLLPPTDHIKEEYQKSQLLVLSSDFEGFGLVIIEAMACGLPVVATDCPYGPSDIIEDGRTGLLAALTVESLAEKMEWLMSHSDERIKMGQQAREAAARYELCHVMPKWIEAYRSVMP